MWSKIEFCSYVNLVTDYKIICKINQSYATHSHNGFGFGTN